MAGVHVDTPQHGCLLYGESPEWGLASAYHKPIARVSVERPNLKEAGGKRTGV